MKKNKLTKWFLLALSVVLFLIFVPVICKNQYLMIVMCNALIYSIAVYGLSVMLGMGGQVTFSTSGIMGIGAFTSGVLTVRLGVHPMLAFLASIIISGIFSLVIGSVLFRLKGTYFAFASIALTQILYVIMLNWRPVTGGAEGLPGIPPFNLGFIVIDSTKKYFYLIFFISLICGLIVHRIRISSLGQSLASIRDNEIAANCLGVKVFRTKVISFVIAGSFAGIAGSLYAFLNSYLSAESFTFDQSAIYLIMVMLGGVASTVGAFIGAVLLTMLPEWMRFLQTYYKLIYGIGVIILMVFMPMGIAGLVKEISARVLKRKKIPAARLEQEKEAVK